MLSLAFAGAMLSCASALAQDAAPSVRIVGRIDESRLVTLHGNTHPLARAEFDRGRVSPDLAMDSLVLVLARSPEQQATFDKFVASQTDPASDNYHRWLEPEEVGERFGPAPGDIDTIRGWLNSHGLTVGEVSKDRMTIHFGGTAEQVEGAFHTEIHNLDVRGEKHIANMSDPRIPAALAPVVVGPKALHNFNPHPLHRTGAKVTYNRKLHGWQRIAEEPSSEDESRSATARPLFGINDPSAGLIEDVTPYDFATIYNVLPLWNKGIDGTGETIAIAGTSRIDASDLTTFRSTFGLPPIPSFTQVVANGIDPGECGITPANNCSLGDQFENSLDVEWSGAVAKGAKIVLVVSGGNAAGTIDTIYESSNYVVNNKTASILNVSYGLCELGEGTAGNTTYKNMWQSAYTEGIAVFVASGDSGSANCDQGGDSNGTPYAAEYGLTVSGIASTPYDTAVGGTDFNWCDPAGSSNCQAAPYWSSSNNGITKANATNYIPEVPWNDSCASKVGIEFAGYWDNQLYQAGISNLPNTPADGEQACNFYVELWQTIYQLGGPDLSSFVDTVGGGGGKSSCTTSDGQTQSSCAGGYAKPAWQADVTGIPTDGKRDIPDVSFFAADGMLGSAYLICESPGNAACTYSATSEPTAQEVGGTSAASPAMAGVMALINQHSGSPQGNPNASLYALAAKQNYSSCSTESVKNSSSCYFNDIDTQSNVQPCDHSSGSPNCQDLHGDNIGTLLGYTAGKGFDQATGLGSLNVANVINAWPIAQVPTAGLSATSLKFAGTTKGTSSAAQTITLSNTGHGALTLNGSGEGIEINGAGASSFTQTNTCGASLAINASCEIKVVFKPAAAGTLTASLSIADNAPTSPQTVSLTGLGTAPAVKLSLTSLAFPSTGIGGKVVKQLSLRNSGTAALTLSGSGKGILISGPGLKSFSDTNNCGASLAAGRSCTIIVSFKPVVGGALSATLSIADDAPGSPQKVALTGKATGAGAVLSRASLAFGNLQVGKTSIKKTVILTNTGVATLAISSIAVKGLTPNSFIETNNCGTSVATGKACTITVAFKPLRTGNLSAAVIITDKAIGSPQQVTMTGTGQ